MRISDWSSDVCSSDLAATSPATCRPLTPISPTLRCPKTPAPIIFWTWRPNSLVLLSTKRGLMVFSTGSTNQTRNCILDMFFSLVFGSLVEILAQGRGEGVLGPTFIRNRRRRQFHLHLAQNRHFFGHSDRKRITNGKHVKVGVSLVGRG